MHVRTVDTRAHFAGMTLPSPIIVSPIGGMPRFHTHGDLEMARGATRDGGMTVVAGGCSWPLETIGAAATGPLMFQLYWQGDRDWVAEKLQHVHAGGYKTATKRSV
jgi:isopentenyl diphosphate isomerase/L-lactate dehydrogenase-like FMN-dependent dehydrogenase